MPPTDPADFAVPALPDPSNAVYPEASDPWDSPNFSPDVESNSPPSEGLLIRYSKGGNPDFDLQPPTLLESTFRHSCWAARRAQVWKALQDLHVSGRQLEAFACCGAALWADRSSDGQEIRLRCNGCRHRFCVPCQVERSRRMLANLHDHIEGRPLRFVTFTLRHSNTPLRDQIDRLLRSFLVFRRRALWTEHVAGGAAFLEVKLSDKTGLWHPHLHCLVEGDYFPQAEISASWHAVTGDSTIVDIRRPTSWESVTHYVVKYVTKPASAAVFSQPDKLLEMISAMTGRHLCMTFGSWRGFKLTEPPPSDVDWQPLGGLENLRRRFVEGDPEAERWLYAICRKYPAVMPLLGVQFAGP